MQDTSDTTKTTPSPWSGLSTRIASAVIAGGVFITMLWMGGFWFNLLIFMAAIMMIREWNALTDHNESHLRLAGLFYVSIPCASLLWLRSLGQIDTPDLGIHAVLFVMVSVWATDIGAYFVGRAYGATPLAPSISPKKTWEGLGGGVLAAIIAAQLCELALPLDYEGFNLSMGMCALLGMLMAVVGQAGDLFESWMKRRAGVKDSGTLIPGHGGLLDRIDGLIFTLPLFALILWWMQPA